MAGLAQPVELLEPKMCRQHGWIHWENGEVINSRMRLHQCWSIFMNKIFFTKMTGFHKLCCTLLYFSENLWTFGLFSVHYKNRMYENLKKKLVVISKPHHHYNDKTIYQCGALFCFLGSWFIINWLVFQNKSTH